MDANKNLRDSDTESESEEEVKQNKKQVNSQVGKQNKKQVKAEEPNSDSDDSDSDDSDSDHEPVPTSDLKSKSENKPASKPASKPKREDGPPPKPLSDDDVLEITSKLASLDGKVISDICNGYVQQIKGLISTIKKSLNPKTDEDEIVELERVMRLVNMCPTEELFIRSKDKIWHARWHILDRDADWFLNRDYSASIKKDAKQKMIETLIRMIQARYHKLSNEEREVYWTKAIEMLDIVGQFKKLTNGL